MTEGRPPRWLIDTSALARLEKPQILAALQPRLDARRIGVCIATEAEVGYSARSLKHYTDGRAQVINQLSSVAATPDVEPRIREVQYALARRGRQRAAGFADLYVAAVAEVHQLIVLHYDKDFDLIAEVTGQPTEWVVPRGTVD